MYCASLSRVKSLVSRLILKSVQMETNGLLRVLLNLPRTRSYSLLVSALEELRLFVATEEGATVVLVGQLNTISQPSTPRRVFKLSFNCLSSIFARKAFILKTSR